MRDACLNPLHTRPSTSDPQVARLLANQSVFLKSKWVQIHNAGYEYAGSGPYGNGSERIMAGSIEEFPMQALLVCENQLHFWESQSLPQDG